jgi:DNA-binding MarR family transcriptional regulator
MMEETEPSLARELLETLSRFDRAFHLNSHRFMGQGHKPGQAFLLFIIRKHEAHGEEGGIRVSDIACRLHVSASNVTQMVTDLEEKGLVVRKMDASDRRAVKVSLSPAGREAVDEMRKPLFERMQGLVALLGEDRTRTLMELLAVTEGFFLEGLQANRDRDSKDCDKEYQDQ